MVIKGRTAQYKENFIFDLQFYTVGNSYQQYSYFYLYQLRWTVISEIPHLDFVNAHFINLIQFIYLINLLQFISRYGWFYYNWCFKHFIQYKPVTSLNMIIPFLPSTVSDTLFEALWKKLFIHSTPWLSHTSEKPYKLRHLRSFDVQVYLPLQSICTTFFTLWKVVCFVPSLLALTSIE